MKPFRFRLSNGAGIFLLCVFLSLFGALFPAPAQAAAAVRVGYYQNGELFYRTPDGIYSGYDVDYLYEVAKYTGWVYEFVDCGTFENMLAELAAGSIDIVPALFRTEERQKHYLYSDDDMGKINVTLIAATSDYRYSYGNFESFSGMRVGVIGKSAEADSIRSWVKEKGLDIQVVEYGSLGELEVALDSGSLDTIGISDIGPSEKYKVIAEFDPHFIYFLMPPDRQQMMGQLNSALSLIAIRNPSFKNDVYDRYLTYRRSEHPAFTRFDREYIVAQDPIPVAFRSDNPPLSFLAEDGTLSGALPDYFAEITSLCGLKFRPVPVATDEEAETALKNGKVRMIAALPEEPAPMAARNIRLTDFYLRLPMVQVMHAGSGTPVSIAVPEPLRGSFTGGGAGGLSGQLAAHYYPGEAACLSAFQSGKEDALFCSSVYAGYLVSHSRSGAYAVTALTGYSSRVAMGVALDGDSRLFSIVNRCIQYTSSETIDELLTRYSAVTDNSLSGVINRLPAAAIIGYTMVLLLLVIFLIVLLILLHKRTEREQALAAEQEKIREETRANAERTTFFGSVSHDMRTPLNAIIGFAELSKNTESLPVLRDYNEKILRSGLLLRDLIDDTLVISRISAGKLELHPEATDAEELFAAVLVPIREAAEKKGVAFRFSPEALKNRTFLVDRLSFRKILLNLLSNAVKFTPAGGTVELTAAFEPPDAGNPDFVFSVRDTGIGISEAFLPEIFKPFVQEKRKGYESVGTGLGLSIVRQLVDLMGGTVSVRSELGRGTQFTVRLHLPEAETGADRRLPEPGRMNPDLLQGKKILVCEDNLLNREIAASLLKERGMIPETAENGREGLRIFAASRPGEFYAVLMDIRMPEMDGYETAAAIRRLDRADAGTVPIIAMTADAFEEDVKRCLAAGMNAHLAKPVDPERLVRALTEGTGGRCEAGI